jgi:AraC-like DNA-binding protein
LKLTLYTLLFGLALTSTDIIATDTLSIKYNSLNIEVDGNLDEWQDIDAIVFTDTLTKLKTIPEFKISSLHPDEFDFSLIKLPKSRNTVEVKMYWNMDVLNFALKVYDEHIFSEQSIYTEKPMLHLNDGIEVYIDTKNEAGLRMDINDYQFMVDVINNRQVFRGERQLIIVDTLAVPKDFDQNVLFYSAVKQSESNDKYYVIELSIPFAAIGMKAETGKVIGMDIGCNDIDYSNKYAVVMEFASSVMWSFNWNGYSDFGYPKYWSSVKLAGGPGFIERISEQYKANWFYIYVVTVLMSFFVLIGLFVRYRKYKRIPHAKDIAVKKIVIVDKDDDLLHKSENEKLIYSATEYVTKNRNEQIKSEDVANHLSISLRNLQRITKDELNLTPTQFIQIVKLRLAAEFLKERRGNVTDASYEHGFSDPAYFSKTFKRHFGISPIEYSNAKST